MKSIRGLMMALSLVVLMASGCGYRTAGKASRLPNNLRTIAVPAFKNQTENYRIETLLTGAVVSELNSRTNYRVVSDPAQADAVVNGVVVSATTAPVTYDSQTGRASSALVTVTMKVTFVDKNNRVLYENQNFLYREQYQISADLASFFQEEGPALDRVSRDFARSFVSSILEAY